MIHYLGVFEPKQIITQTKEMEYIYGDGGRPSGILPYASNEYPLPNTATLVTMKGVETVILS